ncbi:protein-methionine-sulfoxide reductase heme-binding subunit MsrQ [Vibrio sp. CK2-1]|uniref:protein-methionine-sulfoxide reductase heme-binding subunit MsrQ n=1 Tax=Vibrio sp. CK2-1 TaxID=2912249 RepID=UPI001F1A8095|nr:protein-methionine-sulfoxide reductase heme-binding subunit MsrQ [Vibrio sp. CK2-1]MCF7355007.1 protein-methionine-sulfoxide reductase heme-binding subunit MsrQ [Vibrio sp. CK2-1]
MPLKPKHIIGLKVFIHLAQIFSFTWLVFAVINGHLGADPVQPIIHFTGKAALNTLLITLLISPLAKKFKQGQLIRARRLLGVYSFAWAVIHLTAFAWLDLALQWQLIGSEIIKRPYLVLGAVIWIILLLLTITSTQAMQRKMGRKWQQLHNWVYLAAILAPIHYYWSVKSEILEPSLYIGGALLLLWLRKEKVLRWLDTLLPSKASTAKKSSKS